MEYVPGGSLRSRIGRLDHDQAAEMLDGVLAGLAHAHTRGIVHRDLKPENLLFARDGTIKIVDFGIAKALADTTTSLTADSGLLGSPTYLAPEQALGGPVGPWTDLYSIGVIAYELFVGTPPFQGSAIPELLLRHVNDPVPAPRERRPDLPPQLERWILRLLEKDGDRRPQDAAAVAAELDAVMSAWRGPTWRQALAADEDVPPWPMHDAWRRARERLPARWSWRGVAALALVVGAAAAQPRLSDGLNRLELATVDLRFEVRGGHRPASDIAIVGFDKTSDNELSDQYDLGWPQPRRANAQLIDALWRDGADVIVYPDAVADTRLAVGPSATAHTQGSVIVDAIKRASDAGTRVVIGDATWSSLPANGMLSFGQSSALLRSGGVQASPAYQPDADGIIRRIKWGSRVDPATLAIAVAAVAAGGSAGQSRPAGESWINFAGAEGTIPIVPWVRVTKGRLAKGTFRGKVVVVGSAYLEQPLRTATSDQMYDVEIAANAIATARADFPLRDVPRLLGLLLTLSLTLLPLVARRWGGQGTIVVLSLSAVVGYTTIACIAFARGAVLPVVYPCAALALMTLATLVLGPPSRR
jgi:CHASE2 domain-containing sensor protein